MGIFKKDEKEKTILEIYMSDITKLKDSLYDYRAKSQVIDYLERINRKETINPFNTDELLIEVLNKYLSLNIEYNEDLAPFIIRIKDLFDEVYISGKTNGYPNFDLFLNLYDQDGIIDKNIFNINFYRMFIDNSNYFVIMNALISLNLNNENYTKIINFFISIRGRYIDEEEYKFDLISFINKIIYQNDIDKLITTEKNLINKRNGIYEIDEATLDMIHEKVRGAQGFTTKLEELIEKAKKLTASLKNKTDNYKSDLVEINEDSLTNYLQSIETATLEIKRDIETFRDEINEYQVTKQNEIAEKAKKELSTMIIELNNEKTKIVSSLKSFESALSTVALTKTTELTKLGEEQISRLNEVLANSGQLKDLLSNIIPSKETMELIISASKQIANEKENNLSNLNIQPNIITKSSSPLIIRPFQNVDNTINKYFDKQRSFTSRLNEIKEKMQKNTEEKGILYHSQTLKIITALMEDVSPYLYGPSGGGKSMAVSLIADLLEIPYINIGYITEEYQVTGAEPFLGNFKPSSIHECYQLGKLGFIDEFDNGNAKACVSLNPFLRHSEDYYTFANGERVKRHPNFRMITAGNTIGRGGTRNHETREAIEESVLQRLVLFYIGYDEVVEKSILKDFPEWYNFIIAFRKAQSHWEGNIGELTVTDAVTTSDAAKIDRYLKDKAFTPEEIMALDFVQAKDKDYLDTILVNLKEYYMSHKNQKDYKLYELFDKASKEYCLKMGYNR